MLTLAAGMAAASSPQAPLEVMNDAVHPPLWPNTHIPQPPWHLEPWVGRERRPPARLKQRENADWFQGVTMA